MKLTDLLSTAATGGTATLTDNRGAPSAWAPWPLRACSPALPRTARPWGCGACRPWTR